MAKSSFRIIAVRPITPIRRDDETISRVKSIQKKAFGNDLMYFYGGYHLTDIPKAVADEYDLQPLYGHFLEVPEEVDNDKSRADYTHTLMNLILNNKSNEQVNQWISVLLRFKEIERADMEYFHSHVSDVVSFISKENLDAINGLFAANNLQPIGVNQAEVTLGIADEDLPF